MGRKRKLVMVTQPLNNNGLEDATQLRIHTLMSCITGGVEPEFKKKKKKSLSKSEVEALSPLTATGVHSGIGAFVVVIMGLRLYRPIGFVQTPIWPMSCLRRPRGLTQIWRMDYVSIKAQPKQLKLPRKVQRLKGGMSCDRVINNNSAIFMSSFFLI